MRQKSQQFLSTFLLTGIIFTFRFRRGPHFFQFTIDFSLPRGYNIPRNMICGRSSMVEHQLPKLNTRVRFPSPAPRRGESLWLTAIFIFENRGYAVRTTAPPRKKSRLLRLLPCKRGRDASAALTTFCGKGQGRSFFSAACSLRTKPRRAKPRGILLSLRVILAPARLTRPRTAWEFAKLPFCSAKPRFLQLGERGATRFSPELTER